MKAKITKPDGTIVELEGEPLELVMFLPDLKGFELPKQVFIPTIFEVKCTCAEPWYGITPKPECPLHPYTYRITVSGDQNDPITTTEVKSNQPPWTDRELEFNP